MKLDPSTITKAREWFAKRWVMFAVGIAGLFLLAVLVVNLHEGASQAKNTPTKVVAAATAPAVLAKAPTVEQAPASHVIPQIAQHATATPTTVAATAPAAPVPVTAPIQPPAGIQRGYVLQKNYQPDQFGTPVMVSTEAVGVQTVSVQAPSTDGDGERETEWSAWINLTQPVTLAWVRLAGGEGTVKASIDGATLGEPVDHWQSQGSTQTFASIPLAAGWHQITIRDSRRSWVRGTGVAVQIALGTSETDPVSPQPWAVPPGAQPSAVIPQIAQQPAPVSASTDIAPKPATATTAGGAP